MVSRQKVEWRGDTQCLFFLQGNQQPIPKAPDRHFCWCLIDEEEGFIFVGEWQECLLQRSVPSYLTFLSTLGWSRNTCHLAWFLYLIISHNPLGQKDSLSSQFLFLSAWDIILPPLSRGGIHSFSFPGVVSLEWLLVIIVHRREVLKIIRLILSQ